MTVVVPLGKIPGARLLVTTALQLSVAVGGVQEIGLQLEKLAGQLCSTGFSVSFTVTPNEQDDVFPEPSVTTKVTVVGPLLKVCVPSWLIPVSDEDPPEAPLSDQESAVTLQLSAVMALGTATLAEH